jgi:hypothetical protein
MTVDHWDLVLTEESSGRTATLRPPQTERFWADPFLIPADDDGPPTVLCEEYDHRTDLGTVVEVTLTDDLTVDDVTPILNTGAHESYPFTFELDGGRYCIPETAQLGSVDLYARTTGGWQRERSLLPDVAGLDTTLFVDSSGLLWLFGSRLSAPDELRLWYADGLDGRWEPHPAGPVLTSAKGGRSAGRIRVDDGRIIRPGQDSSERYGGSIIEYEIVELTVDRYREEERHRIEPPQGYVGTHTIDRVGRWTIVDAARRRSIISHRSFLQWRLRKTVRQLTGREV